MATVQAMPRQKRNDTAVKVDADLIRMARTISSYNDQSLAEYLTVMLRPLIEKEFEKFTAKLQGKAKPRDEK